MSKEGRERNRADRRAQAAKELDEIEIEREWEISPDWNAYVHHVREELFRKMNDSGMNVVLHPKRAEDVDVKLAVEIGLGLMLDKPVILVVPHGTVVSERMLRVADEVVYGSPEDAKDALMAAINRVGATLGDDDEADR